MSNKFGKALRRSRIQAGFSQVEFANKVKVKQASVSNWERGKTKPSDELKDKINAILGIPADLELAPTPVAVWLTRTRTQKKLSIPELAKLSNLTIATIYNIESGRSPNPHTTSVEALQKALGSSLPKDVAEEIKADATIEGVGELVDFNPYDSQNLPKQPGVYVLYDVSDRPVYVGQGELIGARVNDHEEKFWFKRPIVENGSYIIIKDKTLRLQVEKVLIKFLKSNAVLNKQHVER